ncbi:MAG: hypothetical protein Q7K33_03985 [Candidatus Berkelbacteria bacterium]|nr:hypothetical protein [Candidatus Berkelbacteria bacterium]
MKRVFILVGLIALVAGLLAGFAGGYYYKDFKAAEDTDSLELGGGSYFTRGQSATAVVDPSSKRPKFSTVKPVGSFSNIYMCPVDVSWRNVTPSFIWEGQNLGKIFPKKVNTAETIIRKEIRTNYSPGTGPMKKVRTDRNRENDKVWFGEEYTWKIQELDTNKDGEIDYIEAVSVSVTSEGQDVYYVYEFNRSLTEETEWPLESDLLGPTRVEQDEGLLKPIPLCKKATGSGE